jgi:hypothetical protein
MSNTSAAHAAMIPNFKMLEQPRPYYYTDRVTGKPLGATTWRVYRSRARATSQIDFGCDFQADGCKGFRDKVYHSQTKDRACCSYCSRNLGYLKQIAPGTAKQYEALWDKDNGFWSEGKGCALPRELRSVTCLTFSCFGDRKVYDLIQIGVKPKKELIRAGIEHQHRDGEHTGTDREEGWSLVDSPELYD